MEQKTNPITAEVIWEMHQKSMPRAPILGVSTWDECPVLMKAGYHGIAVRLADKQGLPLPVAPLGVPIAMLDDAVRGTAPELPDTPPRK